MEKTDNANIIQLPYIRWSADVCMCSLDTADWWKNFRPEMESGPTRRMAVAFQ